jgi:signal transduction histidine kinase
LLRLVVAAVQDVLAGEAEVHPAPGDPRGVGANDRPTGPDSFAGDMAHVINNPLAVVSANLTFVLEELERAADAAGAVRLSPGEARELRAALDDAMNGARRVQDAVRSLETSSPPPG